MRIFVIRNQPMFIIGLLMILVTLYSLFIYWEIIRFWYGYILILVFLRGVLVIFSYVIRLIPNERFEFLRLVILIIIFLSLFLREYYSLNKIDFSFVSLFLWEGILLGYIIYLVIFLLSIIVIVIYVRCPQVGALRL